MQICVFPVFTFPRIVNKTDVVFMVSIVIVCSYYHCSVQVGPAQCPPFELLVSFSMMKVALDIILMDVEFGYIGTKLSGSKAKLKVIQHSQQSPSLMNGSYYHFEL